MSRSTISALITDFGRRVLLRLEGRFYELSQEELRSLLGLPAGPLGLGITIDRGRVHFDFAIDGQIAVVSARQLHGRLAKQPTDRQPPIVRHQKPRRKTA